MTSDEQIALRAMLREEVNTAIYASEQRIGENIKAIIAPIDGRLDKLEATVAPIDGRFDQLDGRLNKLEAMIAPMGEHLILLRASQREIQGDLTQVKSDLTQVITVLDEATIQINDLQHSQRALEARVEENTLSVRRDIQKLANRLTEHENTPIDRAHPHSAA